VLSYGIWYRIRTLSVGNSRLNFELWLAGWCVLLPCLGLAWSSFQRGNQAARASNGMSAFMNPPAVICDEGVPALWEALVRYITVLEYEPVRRHGTCALQKFPEMWTFGLVLT